MVEKKKSKRASRRKATIGKGGNSSPVSWLLLPKPPIDAHTLEKKKEKKVLAENAAGEETHP